MINIIIASVTTIIQIQIQIHEQQMPHHRHY